MRLLFILITAVSFVHGCGSGQIRDDAADTQAVALYNSGQYEEAATEYLRLARTQRDAQAQGYRLSAAEAWIRAGRIEQAESITGNMDPAQIPDALLAQWYTVQAGLHESKNRPIDALLARITLQNYPGTSSQVEDNAGRIWDLINRIGPDQLVRALRNVPAALRPWIELAAIQKNLSSKRTELENALGLWSAANPDHPANRSITARIIAASNSADELPTHIALLLPLTGIYEPYSKKIRDGFMAAWFERTTWKPEVRIYNADASNIEQVYRTAVEAGADFVVGPLQKEAVKILADMRPAPVRTLALNQIDTPANVLLQAIDPIDKPPADFVQFGLPPEDEAREVARRGIAEGHGRVLIIASADEFGRRIVDAFKAEWTSRGGQILEQVNYDSHSEDFIVPVKQLLNIDSSEARIALLRQRLGRNMNVAGRLRGDTDFIFMAATNPGTRQIVPHLKFFGANAIPVYTISNVYTGTPDPRNDVDLDGVEFVDMPSLFDDGSPGLRRAAGLPRYYAFGIDAFNLIPLLGQLAADRAGSVAGATGRLYLDDGIVHRHLVWARFTDGTPRIISTTALPPE